MKTIFEYIIESDQTNLVSDIKNNIEENPTTVNMMTIEDSPIDWKKISRLKPEKFVNLFKDKTLLLYVPVGNIGSFGDGSFAKNAKGVKNSYYNWETTAIFITNIDNDGCKVYSVIPTESFSYGKFVPSVRSHQSFKDEKNSTWYDTKYIEVEKLQIQQVLDQIKALSLAVFSKSKTQSKVFIIDAKHLDMKNTDVVKNFFKPIVDACDKGRALYNEMTNEISNFVETKGRRIEKLSNIRKGATWNYVTWGNGTLWIVGYAKGIAISREYDGRVKFNYPHTISVSTAIGYNRFGSRNNDNGGYKITSKQYEKIESIVNKYEPEILKYNKVEEKVWNEWISKFVMGQEIDFEWLSNKEEKEIEQNSEKTPEENNNPESGSEKVKATKKALATAEAKMDAWHAGTRKQNLKSCSDDKLKMNYQICKDKGYEAECKAIEVEAKSRGLSLTTNESLINLI